VSIPFILYTAQQHIFLKTCFFSIPRKVSQELITDQVKALAAKGASGKSLVDLGYDRIGIDDGWQACGAGLNGSFHTAAGAPIINTTAFPDLKAMNTFAHSLDVKTGFYGNNCYSHQEENVAFKARGGNPLQDSKLTGDLEFDGIKVDGCGPAHNISVWYEALVKTGRKIMLENCGDNHNAWSPPTPAEVLANCDYHMYRVSTDIAPQFESAMFNLQFTAAYQDKAHPASHPGCWAYPDMLQVGNGAMSFAESRSHFAAWCVVSSPLVLGFDLTDATIMKTVMPLISNAKALQINQEWAGSPGFLVKNSTTSTMQYVAHGAGGSCNASTFKPHTWGCEQVSLPDWQVWAKPLKAGDVAVFVVSIAAAGSPAVTVTYDEVGFTPGKKKKHPGFSQDVWSGHSSPLAAGTGSVTFAKLAGHDSSFVVLSQTQAQ